MSFDRDAYDEDLRAELGYSYASEREVKLREWNDTREDAGYERLVKRLRQNAWGRKVTREGGERLERRRQIGRESARRGRAKHVTRNRERLRARRRKAPIVCRCVECGATWCRVLWVRGVAPSVCGPTCAARYGYHRRQLAAGKVSRRTGHVAAFGAGLGLVAGGGVSPMNAAATVRERVLRELAKRGAMLSRDTRALCAEIPLKSYSQEMQQLRMAGVIVREGWAKGARWKLAAGGREETR